MGTASAVAGIGELVVVVALVYFLLIVNRSFYSDPERFDGYYFLCCSPCSKHYFLLAGIGYI
jgi:hypothetical protein